MADERRPPTTPPGQAGKPPKPAGLCGLLHADGWRAMYWSGNQHTLGPFTHWGWTEDDPFPRPLRYLPSGAWVWCDEEPDFCAVIPQSLELEEFAPQCPKLPHAADSPEGRT